MKRGNVQKENIKAVLISSFTNVFLAIIKFSSGVLFNSQALVVDAFNSLSDLITDIISIISINKSYVQADEEHPFGHGKIEYIASLSTAFILYFGIISLSINLIKNDHLEVDPISGYALIIVLFTIICKYSLSKFLFYKGNKSKNEVLLANAKESRADVYTSIIVIVGIIAEVNPIYQIKSADFIASLIILIILSVTATQILITSIKALLGQSASIEEMNFYYDKIMENENVYDVSHLTVLKSGPFRQLHLNVELDGNLTIAEGHTIIHQIEDDLRKNDNVKVVTIHIDPHNN